MRLCRFDDNRLGLVNGTTVRDVSAALDVLPAFRYPLPAGDVLIYNLEQLTREIRSVAGRSASVPLKGLTLLSPVANPGKLIGAPVNYQKHLDEVRQNPQLHHGNDIPVIQKAGVFLKATSSLVGPGEGIVLRKLDRRNDHEVELAFVIGKPASNVSRRSALDYVAGYSIGLDITIRGPEERSLRKSSDSYTVLGPWLVTPDELPDPGALDLNQATQTHAALILGVPELIEYASSFYTLYPGDVVLSGTPEGVGPIKPGDVIVASIEAIGTMEVKVR